MYSFTIFIYIYTKKDQKDCSLCLNSLSLIYPLSSLFLSQTPTSNTTATTKIITRMANGFSTGG
ncbi:hypothetical protein HanIR_Chr08g0385161 [Helianthus annuus]|nr:hypothetical protein HanIR_Chr08g0385161 [Helianthus annuus]